jgi:hypothetical protein
MDRIIYRIFWLSIFYDPFPATHLKL